MPYTTHESIDVVMLDVDDNFLEFTLFPTLPMELRLKVIEVSLEEIQPRTFVVSHSIKNPFHSLDASNISVPSLLHVNKESRRESLKVYKLSFSGPLGHKPIYFNFAQDKLAFKRIQTFVLMKNSSTPSAWKKVERNLRFLIIGGEFYGIEGPLHHIAWFHKLKVFVHQNQDEGGAPWLSNTQANNRLKMVLEGNWAKSHEFEEVVAVACRSACLIPEPSLKPVCFLPKIEILSAKDMDLLKLLFADGVERWN